MHFVLKNTLLAIIYMSIEYLMLHLCVSMLYPLYILRDILPHKKIEHEGQRHVCSKCGKTKKITTLAPTARHIEVESSTKQRILSQSTQLPVIYQILPLINDDTRIAALDRHYQKSSLTSILITSKINYYICIMVK